MDEVRDVAGISIPFTAGVAAGFWFAGGAAAHTDLIPSAFLVLTAYLAISARRSHALARFAAAYLACGMFCGAAASAGAVIDLEPGGIAARCGTWMKELIDSIPFSSQDTNALIKALLTGDRSSLSRSTVGIFRNSGASHILALSGLHLGTIYLIISKCLSVFGNSPMSRHIRCWCVIIAAGFYTLMTGAGASIVRAFLFICIRELSGIATGRRQGAARTLLICLTVQLALFPQEIRSTGFQLSYLAMCGIVTVLPVLQSWYPEAESRMERLDPVRWIWNAAALSIACQLFTAPLSWIRFHSFPKYFLVTNISALPLTTLIMFTSVMTVALQAMGVCPTLLIETDERLISMLTGVLEAICGL